MNYLVTGGRGFIGCHTIRQLQEQGHKVICIAHNTDNTSMHEVLTPEQIAGITIVVGSLDDRQFLIDTMSRYNIDRVIHLAGILGDLAEVDPYEACRVNILGTINVFEAMLAVGLKRVIFGSSTSIFGTEEYYEPYFGKETLPNDVFLHPTLVYGGTKMFLEFIGNWYYENRGLETIALRYSLVYGVARQRGSGQFATEIINKPAMGLPGRVENGDTVPDFIYVEDAARATIIASQCANPKFRAFVICGERKSLHELRKYVLSLLPGSDITLLPGVYPSSYNLDWEAAKSELGYEPEYTLERGVKTTINLIREKHGLAPV